MVLSLGLCELSERSAGGFVTLQPDPLGGQQGGGAAMETISPLGFRSRPQDPTTDIDGRSVEGASLVTALDGREGFAWPAQDPRWAPFIPSEGKGGAVFYACVQVGAWRDTSYVLLEGDDGAITIRVPVAAGAREHTITLDPTTDEIVVSHGSGTTIRITAAGLVKLGGDGATPVALATPLDAWAATVAAALASLGSPVGPLASAATKVNAL